MWTQESSGGLRGVSGSARCWSWQRWSQKSERDFPSTLLAPVVSAMSAHGPRMHILSETWGAMNQHTSTRASRASSKGTAADSTHHNCLQRLLGSASLTPHLPNMLTHTAATSCGAPTAPTARVPKSRYASDDDPSSPNPPPKPWHMNTALSSPARCQAAQLIQSEPGPSSLARRRPPAKALTHIAAPAAALPCLGMPNTAQLMAPRQTDRTERYGSTMRRTLPPQKGIPAARTAAPAATAGRAHHTPSPLRAHHTTACGSTVAAAKTASAPGLSGLSGRVARFRLSLRTRDGLEVTDEPPSELLLCDGDFGDNGFSEPFCISPRTRWLLSVIKFKKVQK
eukprot:Hpha_TRINITY_DN15925_c3_g7::TRINITY_DN15925_c3_g7_i1::g.72503::m.72503